MYWLGRGCDRNHFLSNLRETKNLQQKFPILSSAISNLSPRSRCCILCRGQVSVTSSLVLNQLSSLSIHSHNLGLDLHQAQEMEHAGDNEGIAELKVNILCLYEMVAIGIMDAREIAKEVNNLVDIVGYTSYQISNHDSRIDDNEMNLKEIMGKVDRIQEDLQRLVQMNQGSQVHENPEGAIQNMEEEFVIQPVGHSGNP